MNLPTTLSMCILASLGPLSAQELASPPWQHKVEIFGSIARSRFSHGDHVLGVGRDYGLGIGVRPFSGKLRNLGLEVQWARLKAHESTAVYPAKDLRSSLVMANALYHFGNGESVQPFVFGGLGLVKTDYYRSCTGCVFDRDPASGELTPRLSEDRLRATKLGVTLGAGLKIAVFRRIAIRPEFLFVSTTPGSGANLGWIRLQIGIGARF